MSKDKLFVEVELALRRELTPEERKCIALAEELKREAKRPREQLKDRRKAS